MSFFEIPIEPGNYVDDVLEADSCYKVLSLEKHASSQDVKDAYNRLIFKIHESKDTSSGASYANDIVRHSAAILLDPKLRRKYDRTYEYRPVPNILYLYHLSDKAVRAILVKHGIIAIEGVVPGSDIEIFASPEKDT